MLFGLFSVFYILLVIQAKIKVCLNVEHFVAFLISKELYDVIEFTSLFNWHCKRSFWAAVSTITSVLRVSGIILCLECSKIFTLTTILKAAEVVDLEAEGLDKLKAMEKDTD